MPSAKQVKRKNVNGRNIKKRNGMDSRAQIQDAGTSVK